MSHRVLVCDPEGMEERGGINAIGFLQTFLNCLR